MPTGATDFDDKEPSNSDKDVEVQRCREEGHHRHGGAANHLCRSGNNDHL